MVWPPSRADWTPQRAVPAPCTEGAWLGQQGVSQPAVDQQWLQQSAAKSLLPGIQHQPPPLQKGPSRGRCCCCSMTLWGPGSFLAPLEMAGWHGWVANPKSRHHHHHGEQCTKDGTDWSGLPPQVSQPITRWFMAFLVWEHSWMLWGTLVLGGDQREGAVRPLPTDHHTRHCCQCSWLAAPHHPLQLSQRQQAAAPRPQAQVFALETTVLGNRAALPAWGNPHPATGLNSPRKGGRKIGKTITRICFMLPGSLPARSSVFGRPIYNQQCGML